MTVCKYDDTLKKHQLKKGMFLQRIKKNGIIPNIAKKNHQETKKISLYKLQRWMNMIPVPINVPDNSII